MSALLTAAGVAWETWLLFVAAACIVVIVPGPTTFLLLCRSLSHGRAATAPLVVGVVAGDFVAMTLSMLGLGAMLLASATLFAVCKWFGALYMIYLGIKIWRSPAFALTREQPTASTATAFLRAAFFREAFIVTALNPKAILFFVAFLPQFVAPTHTALPQLCIFGGTYLLLGAVNATLYSVFSVKIRAVVMRPTHQQTLYRISGGALVCAGAAAALVQPAA